MRFLGIDPGLRITGYGCVQGMGLEPGLVEAGVFRLGKGDGGIEQQSIRTADQQTKAGAGGLPRELGGRPANGGRGGGLERPRPVARARRVVALAPIVDRLMELDADITGLLGRLRPDVVAVESLFAHYKHPATAIAMGHARGVILLAVRKAGVQLVELKPNEVKKFLTGHGHASKEQMQSSVQMRLRLAALPEPPDVADAIAMALCAAARG